MNVCFGDMLPESGQAPVGPGVAVGNDSPDELRRYPCSTMAEHRMRADYILRIDRDWPGKSILDTIEHGHQDFAEALLRSSAGEA